MNPLVVPAAAVIVMVPPAAIFTGWHLIRSRGWIAWNPRRVILTADSVPADSPMGRLAGLSPEDAPVLGEREPEMAGSAA